MPPGKSPAEKARQDLSGTSWKVPKCKVQSGKEVDQMSGVEETPTAAASGEGTGQPPRYNYDRLPSLDDEPAGGLRWVSKSSAAPNSSRLTNLKPNWQGRFSNRETQRDH